MTRVPPLTEDLARRIAQGGPITWADFMAEATRAYYASRDPFGRGGDFTTAPEISQMFGELIGLWCVVVWQMMGSPERFVLAELGPGRGTLMNDLLRAAGGAPAFLAAAQVHLVETSPHLTAMQRHALRGRDVSWCGDFDDLPDGPLIVVANELFDALPVRQFIRQDKMWRERMVDHDGQGFVLVAGPETRPALPADLVDAAPDGAIAEICDPARDLAARLGKRLNRQPGFALIIDYGHGVCALGDTVQAVREHRFHGVLDHPGQADITAHVDFQSLAEAAVPARAWGPVGQGDFLRALGIETRATLLARSGSDKVAADIMGQMRRLIDPDEMGTLFKVLALASPFFPAPPGFVV